MFLQKRIFLSILITLLSLNNLQAGSDSAVSALQEFNKTRVASAVKSVVATFAAFYCLKESYKRGHNVWDAFFSRTGKRTVNSLVEDGSVGGATLYGGVVLLGYAVKKAQHALGVE